MPFGVLPWRLWFLIPPDQIAKLNNNDMLEITVENLSLIFGTQWSFIVVAHLLGLLLYSMGEKIYKTDFVLFVKISIVRNTITVIRSMVLRMDFG